MNLKIFKNENDFVQAGSNFIADICKQDQAHINIALSGGSTPQPIYHHLGQRNDIFFAKLAFWQVDERYIPQTHQDSNQKMIKATLQPQLFHCFNTELPIENLLQQYEQTLMDQVKDGFDLCILGIGPDGHTASLFPNLIELHEKKRLVVHTLTNEFAIQDRLSLTFNMILRSKKILVLLKGSAKKEVINELQNGLKTKDEFPAKYLLTHDDLQIMFGDF